MNSFTRQAEIGKYYVTLAKPSQISAVDTIEHVETSELTGVSVICFTADRTWLSCARKRSHFGGTIPNQIRGMPMRSLLSNPLADINMKHFEPRAFEAKRPSFWIRCGYDTFIVRKSTNWPIISITKHDSARHNINQGGGERIDATVLRRTSYDATKRGHEDNCLQ